MTQLSFRTHEGQIVSGPRLTEALAKVAECWRELAYAIYAGGYYAAHVPQAAKTAALSKMLSAADALQRNGPKSFTMRQRVNEELTGECVPLLLKG